MTQAGRLAAASAHRGGGTHARTKPAIPVIDVSAGEAAKTTGTGSLASTGGDGGSREADAHVVIPMVVQSPIASCACRSPATVLAESRTEWSVRTPSQQTVTVEIVASIGVGAASAISCTDSPCRLSRLRMVGPAA